MKKTATFILSFSTLVCIQSSLDGMDRNTKKCLYNASKFTAKNIVAPALLGAGCGYMGRYSIEGNAVDGVACCIGWGGMGYSALKSNNMSHLIQSSVFLSAYIVGRGYSIIQKNIVS